MEPTDHSYERLYKYQIIGAGPTSIGTAEGFWLDQATGELEFVGVRADPLVPYTHAVPADVLVIDDAERSITVPYTMDKVRNAPHFGLHDPITAEDRERIYGYYGTEPPR